jgi:hypothetical protein
VRGGGQGRCASVPRWSEPEGSLLGQDALLAINFCPSIGSPSDTESSDGLPYPLLGLVPRLVAGPGCTRFEHHHASRICSDGYRLLLQVIGRIDNRQ